MLKQFTSVYGEFEYELALEKRRTIAIHVNPDQSVTVKAPLKAKENEVEEFVRSRLRWILKHQRRYAEHKPKPPKKYIAGEGFHYLGCEYKLQVQNAGGDERICIQDDTLAVFSRRPQSQLYTQQLLEHWYKRESRRIFKEQLDLCSERFVPDNPPALAIRRMSSRLGSYSLRTHRVCLNLNLIKTEKKHIDYVIIHELCHITHLSHDEKFYALLTQYLPQWKQLETELESALLEMGC